MVQIVNKPQDGQQSPTDKTTPEESEELSHKKPVVVEELPITYDEVEVDESSPEFEKLADHPVSEQNWR